jgi:hypothetical protein
MTNSSVRARAAETMVVTPAGRVPLSRDAATVLGEFIAKDERLAGTSFELDYALIARVPDAEVEAFCEVLRDWLGGMSQAELAEPEMRQLLRLLEALLARPQQGSDPPAA